MRCQKCGTENPDDAVFCMKCGKDLRRPVDTTKQKQGMLLKSEISRKGILLTFLVLAGIIMIGMGVRFLYIRTSAKCQYNQSDEENKSNSIPKAITFEEVTEYVKPRIASGASASTALGKYQDMMIKWDVRVSKGCICYGLSGTPVQFEKENAFIYGFPSEGLDELKFRIFCEGREGKWVTLTGNLNLATDNPGAIGPDKNIAYFIIVSGVETCSQNTYSQTDEQQSTYKESPLTSTQNYENNQENSIHIDTTSAVGRSLAKIYGNRTGSDKKDEDVNFGNRTRVRSSIRRGSRR